jgi:hypothetical protein
MFGKTRWILAGLLVIAFLMLGVGSSIILAQSPTPTPSKTWTELYWQSLAQKLGTTVEKLQQATTDARKDALAQAVKQGLLTQAQADRMSQRAQGGTALASVATARLDAAAKTLGMSTSDLTTALRGGKTLLDLAREKNVDVTKLRTAIADAEKAALDQAVKDGKMTQVQADALKANVKPENIDLNRKSLGGQPFMGRPTNRFNGGFQNRFGKSGQRPFTVPPSRR